MGALIEINNGVRGYGDYVEHVLRRSRPRAARGLPTREAGFTVVAIHDVKQSLPLEVGRNLSRRIAALEALQLIGGVSLPHLMVQAAPFFGELLEPNHRFHGAYGNRIGGQLSAVVRKLTDDPDTRQAVITLWNPYLDNIPGKKDYPCTVAIGFELVGGERLDMDVIMRSQDVWLGTPYDWFQFSQLMLTVAQVLGAEPGMYRHTTWSTHIYERDVPRLDDLHDPPAPDEHAWQPGHGVGHPKQSIFEVVRRAGKLLVQRLPDATLSESLLHDWVNS